MSKDTSPYLPLMDGNSPRTNTSTNKLSKLDMINAEIDKTKHQMLSNIDATLNRGDKLTDLESKSDQMRNQAVVFKKTASEVKTQFCWQYWKTIILVLVVLIVFYLLTLYHLILDYCCSSIFYFKT